MRYHWKKRRPEPGWRFFYLCTRLSLPARAEQNSFSQREDLSYNFIVLHQLAENYVLV